jgi:glycosyltransferase involved in cell wall biosynthesis
MSIRFSVLTPCFNAQHWIRSCVASVADQQGVAAEHIVQDGGSTDGTAEYLLAEPRIKAESGPDFGMYDAINKAWARATGDFIQHLNADEEVLPGALHAVGAYFQAHPHIDVVLGGTLICEGDGTLHCYRKPVYPPLGILLTSHHPIPSCAVFLRRSSFTERPWLYDPEFRLISDVLLMIDIVRQKKRIGLLNRYTSVFLKTGTNLGLSQSARAQEEYRYQMSLATPWMKAIRPLIRTSFQLRKALAGHYSQGHLEYDLYVPGEEHERKHFVVEKPSGVYRPEQTQEVQS